MDIKKEFFKYFPQHSDVHEYRVFGKTELCGNQTDHQNGQVITATVDRSIRAAVSLNNSDLINIMSEGFGWFSINVGDCEVYPQERGTPKAIVRGIVARYKNVNGFDAYINSELTPGCGLSSSAAFEVLVCRIIEDLFGCKTDPYTLAINARYAENMYYGKPCGLTDQLTCSCEGIMNINFARPAAVVKKLNFDIEKHGIKLCLVDSGVDTGKMTEFRAAINQDMTKVANFFYKDKLNNVNKRDFLKYIGSVREYAGDRAVLRAMHFFDENFRVQSMVKAMQEDDIDAYLSIVNQSAYSSWMLLQNVIPTGETIHQDLAFAISITRFYLEGQGAFGLQDGGFAGMLQAYVPADKFEHFKTEVERILGKGSVTEVHITGQSRNRD